MEDLDRKDGVEKNARALKVITDKAGEVGVGSAGKQQMYLSRCRSLG